ATDLLSEAQIGLAEASLAMPLGHAGFAGVAVSTRLSDGSPFRSSNSPLPRRRLRCRLEAMPALPAWPFQLGSATDLRSDAQIVRCRGVACDAAWRPCRLCRRGRFNSAWRRISVPKLK